MSSKICGSSAESFEVSDKDKDFYSRMNVSEPKLSPHERMRRRLAWRNELKLYRRTCDKSGKQVISVYPAKTKFPVFSQESWWSDSWDPFSYGCDYDFSETFIKQFSDLLSVVPRLAITNRGENSAYCNFSGDFKDSYMCVSGMEGDSCLYCYFTSYSFNCVDCSNVLRSQFCYECVDCQQLYECLFCQDCEHSRNLLFCKNCLGCEDCIGCVGLYKKQYYILNQPYSKSEYQEFVAKLFPLTAKTTSELASEVNRLSSEAIFKFYHGYNNENIVGDYITNCKNVSYSFDIHGGEEIAYCHNIPRGTKVVYDCCYTTDSELVYESISSVSGYNQIGCMYCWNSSDIFYSDHCFYCRNLIGCSGLRNKEYCILNKQLSKEQYLELAPRIIEQMKRQGIWGEFLPVEHSPFAYNDTIAQDYFPLSKEVARSKSLSWSEEPELLPQVDGAKSPMTDNLTEQTFYSSLSGKPFRLIRQELSFYQKFGIPLPELTPIERIVARLRKRNPRQFWNRECCFTGLPLTTTYSPQRPEKIASEEAYQQYMFS